MSNNYTPRLNQLISNAQEESKRLGQTYLGTEHILLGLIELKQGVAFDVLMKQGVNLDQIREEIETTIYKQTNRTTKMNRIMQINILNGINALTAKAHHNSKESGWWDKPDTVDTVPAKLCLIHSEVSEAMEGHRKNLMDDKLPHRKMIEVELADAVIRIADLCGRLELDLGGAIIEKMEFNKTREDHKIENRVKDGGKIY